MRLPPFALALIFTSALALCAPQPALGQAAPAAPAKKARPANPALAPIADEAGLPRVLLIGDSISIGYTLPVRELLKGKANVHRIPENGGPTTNGLAKLQKWIGAGNWDVIHFNWGLHDIVFMTETQRRIEPAEYENNLRALVKQLKATGAKLIWCATTPIPEGELSPTRKAADVVAYNRIAARVMKDNGVAIHDLYRHALPELARIQRPMNVHFTDEGSAFLAQYVAAEIQKHLPRRQ